jgi:hypothetical protein
VTDPLATAVATIVITKAMDGVTEVGRAAVDALVRLVRRRLGADEVSQEILARAEAEPAHDANRLALAKALASSITDDRIFGEELEARWLGVPAGWRATSQEATFNSIDGEIHGNVVQARDIHGGISFGSS